jgi:SAM-dependent methyltransferase
MDYQDAFARRTARYLYAMRTYPDALAQEFQTAVRMLALKPHDVVVNITAGGVPLDKYLPRDIPLRYLPFDTHPDFVQGDICHCNFTSIPLPDASVDKLICLATFHHVAPNERPAIYREFLRILKPGGMFVLGDVIKGSAQDLWLNVFVDTFNSHGHQGIFFDQRDCIPLEAEGFTVRSHICSYFWQFGNDKAAVDFTKHLFGIDILEEDDYLLCALHDYLDYHHGNIPWSLIYFQCTKK